MGPSSSSSCQYGLCSYIRCHNPTGFALVLSIVQIRALPYGPRPCYRCHCGHRPCCHHTNTDLPLVAAAVAAVQIRALLVVSYGPCPCCRCHSRRTKTGFALVIVAITGLSLLSSSYEYGLSLCCPIRPCCHHSNTCFALVSHHTNTGLALVVVVVAVLHIRAAAWLPS